MAAHLDVDDLLELVVRDQRQTPASAGVGGELAGPADELLTAFTLTLVASPHTQRTYRRACRSFTDWHGP